MADKADGVFISYRRQTSKHPALLVFKDLQDHGYDAFIDYESIDSGKFAEKILNQIASREHFVVILSPDCLDRTADPGDWLRREIEYAIETQRNVVPVLFDDFTFNGAQPYLTGKLAPLQEYNGLTVPDGYFDDAMTKLRTRFLKQPAKGVIKPAAKADADFVSRLLRKANDAAAKTDVQLAARKYLGGKVPATEAPSRKSVSVMGAKYLLAAVVILVATVILLAGSSLFKNRFAFSAIPLSTATVATPDSNPSSGTESSRISTFTPTPIVPTETFMPSTTPLALQITSQGVPMVLIPEGTFTMGSETEPAGSDEGPVHEVNLSAYYIDKYEVTNAFYTACVEAGACDAPIQSATYPDPNYADHPITYVNWQMAKQYCKWRGTRLPTEAEWEKAARGTHGRTYPWGEDIDITFANFGGSRTTINSKIVGSYPKGLSQYGVYEMAGNVWEWVADWYGKSYYEGSVAINPAGPDFGSLRVMRGGAWNDSVNDLRTTRRLAYEPSRIIFNVGFRCAFDIP